MQHKISGVVKNINYALFGNGVVFLSSTLMSFLVPRFCQVAVYGYVQMYLFYTGYLGLFNIGWVEGIYLKTGGCSYCQLDKSIYKTQYRLFQIYIVLASIICYMLSLFIIKDDMREIVFKGASLCIIPLGLANFLNNILLTTGRMKEYAINSFLDRLVFLMILLGLILRKSCDLQSIILADLLGKTVAMISARLCFRDMCSCKVVYVRFKDIIKEVWENITCGIKLLIANLSGMLILGSVRMGIEHTWDMETYSQISLTLSISNLLLGFIMAVSQVMYTTLRKVSGDSLQKLYDTLRKTTVMVMAAFLILYYPIRMIIQAFLPKYEFGLRYMAVLFPMCLIECKWNFLIITYLKVLRKEKDILRINLLSVLISLVFTLLSAILLKKLVLAMILVIVSLFIRSVLGEMVLAKQLSICLRKSMRQEALLIFSFILINWTVNDWTCVLWYLIVYVIYVIRERQSILQIIRNIKILSKMP